MYRALATRTKCILTHDPVRAELEAPSNKKPCNRPARDTHLLVFGGLCINTLSKARTPHLQGGLHTPTAQGVCEGWILAHTMHPVSCQGTGGWEGAMTSMPLSTREHSHLGRWSTGSSGSLFDPVVHLRAAAGREAGR